MIKETSTYLRYFWELAVLFVLGCLLFSCGNPTEADARLDAAEKLMEEAPDSSLTLIGQIDTTALTGDSRKARYALLKTQAMDRNYVDTTTFDILQPALDYYLHKGTPAQKLKTLYYKARIYQNRQQPDSALNCLLQADEFVPEVTDSMMLGRLFQNEATVLFEIAKYKRSMELNKIAAEYYKGAGDIDTETWCLQTALEGAFAIQDKTNIKILIDQLNTIGVNDDNFRHSLDVAQLRYAYLCGNIKEVRENLPDLSELESFNEDDKLCLADICCEIGVPELGKLYFSSVDTASSVASSMQYIALKPFILEKNGDYADALNAYKQFMAEVDTLHTGIFNSDLLFAKQKYELEKTNLENARKKDFIIGISIAIGLVIALIALVLFYQAKLNRERYRASLMSLQIGKEELARLSQENERYKEAANTLERQIEQLKAESESLQKAIINNAKLPTEVKVIMKERIDILNKFLTNNILEKDGNREEWLSEILKDKDKFTNDTRLFFKGSNPGFITYLEGRGLSEKEINYLCLYAIGLRGKEIKGFTDDSRAYHFGVEIRKKLGLEERKNHLSRYIRDLLDKF